MVRLSSMWTCSYAIARLQVNRLELTLSIGSFAAALGAMIAGIFGELIVMLRTVFSSHHQSVQHLAPNAARNLTELSSFVLHACTIGIVGTPLSSQP